MMHKYEKDVISNFQGLSGEIFENRRGFCPFKDFQGKISIFEDFQGFMGFMGISGHLGAAS